MIEANNIGFSYQGESVIDSIDLSIDRGECVLIAGPSGCGKTTLGKCLSGIIPVLNDHGQMDGDLLIDDRSSRKFSKIELSERVDAVFDDPDTQIIGLSAEEDVAFGCENLGVNVEKIQRTVESVLKKLDLIKYRTRDPRHMSGGEKQRLAIASAIAKEPEILMLDEPLSQLDPTGSQTVLEMIQTQKQRGTTIILLGRKLGREIQIADRVIALEDGSKRIDTAPKQFLNNTQLVEELGMWFPENQPRHHDMRNHAEVSRENILEINDLWYSYVSNKNIHEETDWALKDVSLEIPEGTVVGLIGHNGSGKTTLSKQFNGLYSPNHGKIWFRDKEITDQHSSSLAGKIGYVFQNPNTQLFTTTVRKEIRYGPENLGYDNIDTYVENALKQVNLEDRIDARISELSRGEKQRVAIASTLALDPEVLILDEPSGGVDYGTFWKLMGELTESFLSPKHSLILISHDPNIVYHWADEVIEMEDGQVLRRSNASNLAQNEQWDSEFTSISEIKTKVNRESKTGFKQ